MYYRAFARDVTAAILQSQNKPLTTHVCFEIQILRSRNNIFVQNSPFPEEG